MRSSLKYLSFFLLLIFLAGGYLIYLWTVPREMNETIIEIGEGETALAIANKLYNKNLIGSRKAFYLYIKLKKYENSLSYGKYLFSGRMNMTAIIKQIKSGKILLNKVTIPEGLPAWKTCRLLAERGFGKYKVFLALCNDSLFTKKQTGFSLPSLEGFLYPETYHFPDNATEEFILSHLVKEFFRQTADLDFNPNEKIDFYKTIILASIVEREAKIQSEKPIIASVYLNRINAGYKLQADPTVAYVLELAGKKRERILYRDLEIDSPYNTYKHAGLPPTPICSPPRSSIAAVLNPAETDYFFFFATGSGGHEFSRTYQQHLRKQKQMKAANGI